MKKINKYYPKLMKGVGGGALHGVIHLGWALYYRHNETAIAEGFAYLTYVNLPVPFPPLPLRCFSFYFIFLNIHFYFNILYYFIYFYLFIHFIFM